MRLSEALTHAVGGAYIGRAFDKHRDDWPYRLVRPVAADLQSRVDALPHGRMLPLDGLERRVNGHWVPIALMSHAARAEDWEVLGG